MKWEVWRSMAGLPIIQPGHSHPIDIKGLQLQMKLQIETELLISFLLLFPFTWARTVQCQPLKGTIGYHLQICLPFHKSLEIFLSFDYTQLETREQVGVAATLSVRLSSSYNHFVVGRIKKIVYATITTTKSKRMFIFTVQKIQNNSRFISAMTWEWVTGEKEKGMLR